MGIRGNEMLMKVFKKGVVLGIIVVLFSMNMISLNGRAGQNQPGSQSASSEHCEDFVENMGIMAYHASLSGYVTDPEMMPIDGARVRVYFFDTYRESYTDATGYYQVTDIPLCYCVMNASCTMLGYYPEYAWLNINESTTHDFIVTPMPVYPVLSGTMGSNGWFITGVTISFTMHGGGNHSYYALDEGSWIDYTVPFSVTTDGEHVLHWIFIDGQGNISGVYWVGFKIDRTAPKIQMNWTFLNLLRTVCLFNASVSDAASGVVKVELYVNDVLVGNATAAPWECLFIGRGLTAQEAVYDAAGNSAWSYKIDGLLHSSCCRSVPNDNSIVRVGTTVYHGTLSGHVTDLGMNPLPGARIRVYFYDTYRESYTDATGYYQVTDIPICNCTKNVSCIKLGYYPAYTWLSIDASTTYDFVLPPMPVYPALSGTMGENNWFVSPVTVTMIANDHVNHFYYALDEDHWTDNYSAPFQVTTDGEHFLEWYWVDDQGNSSAVYWVSFKIDETWPSLNITIKKLCFKTYLFTANSIDQTSGVKKVDFFVDDNIIGSITNLPSWIVWKGSGKFEKIIVYDYAGNTYTQSHRLPLFRYPWI